MDFYIASRTIGPVQPGSQSGAAIQTAPGLYRKVYRGNMIYQLKVAGELDKSWSDWLGSIQIISESQEDGAVFTTLTVDATDQSALFGILDRIRDLNIRLISVTSAVQKI